MIALQAAALALSLLTVMPWAFTTPWGSLAIAALYGWWAILLGLSARRDALLGLAVLAILWPVLAEGIAGPQLCCPGPSAGTTWPLRALDVIVGAAAAFVTARAARTALPAGGWAAAAIGAVLVVAAFLATFQVAGRST